MDNNAGSSAAQIGTLVRISQVHSVSALSHKWLMMQDPVTYANKTASQSMFSLEPAGGRGDHQAGAHAAILGLSSEARVQRQSGHWDRG